jgi:6-phosphogluconolactonase
MTPIREFATRDALMQAAAERIAEALNQGIAERGASCAALSGGGTPESAYRALAALPLDWRKVTFLLVDERFVPAAHDASNEGMLRRALAPALAAGARLLPMFAENTTSAEAAAHANAAYATEKIDIAVMGMGEDGHTASWFPDMPALDDVLDAGNSRTVVAVHATQASGSADRLTLTHGAIVSARQVMLLITGDAKRRRLETALKNRDTPVARLFEPPMSGAETWWAP